jgi:hypothetical protein
MVLADRIDAETVTALFVAYSDVVCFGNLERNLKLEETCAENELVRGILKTCRSLHRTSWIVTG